MTMTQAATAGAARMGMTRRDMEDVIRALSRKDFYKSTTTFHDHRIWINVYHGRTEDHEIYIKFVQDAVTEFSCTSFKEKNQ